MKRFSPVLLLSVVCASQLLFVGCTGQEQNHLALQKTSIPIANLSESQPPSAASLNDKASELQGQEGTTVKPTEKMALAPAEGMALAPIETSGKTHDTVPVSVPATEPKAVARGASPQLAVAAPHTEPANENRAAKNQPRSVLLPVVHPQKEIQSSFEAEKLKAQADEKFTGKLPEKLSEKSTSKSRKRAPVPEAQQDESHVIQALLEKHKPVGPMALSNPLKNGVRVASSSDPSSRASNDKVTQNEDVQRARSQACSRATILDVPAPAFCHCDSDEFGQRSCEYTGKN